MQAMQSGTASEWTSGWLGYSGQFAALRYLSRQMNFNSTSFDPHASACARRPMVESDAPAAIGVAEGAGLAHDASNLLGALSLYSDLLGMPGVLHEEHREYAEELRLLSDRSWAMIDRLVNHAQTHQRPKMTAEKTLFPHVIDRCKGLLSRIAGRTVETSYGVGAFEPVSISAEAVERIVTNLVKNAAEATAWVGVISIDIDSRLERMEDGSVRRRVRLTVRDRGCGMDSATVKKLMEGTAALRANGRGLGFRVVRELVALSGGCLSVESQPEVGTSVSAEWYAVSRDAGERAADRDKAETKKLWKGDAGWIAC